MKAKLIAIEGSDGSGKQTQSILLEQNLRAMGYKVFRYAFPSYGEKQAKLAEEYLSGSFGDENPRIASACFAVDRMITFEKLAEDIELYDYIILDRYVKSNIIHQSRKMKSIAEKEEFIKWVENLEYNSMGIPRENACIFLNMPPEYSMELISNREIKGVKNDILENLENMKLAHQNAMDVIGITGMIKVDCVENGILKTREQIAEEVLKIVTA